MKNFKIDYELIYISLVIILSEGMFYLFNDSSTIMLKRIPSIMSLILAFVYFLKYTNMWRGFVFRNIIITLIMLMFVELINTYFIHGQQIYVGSILNLKYLIYLNYFFISYYIRKGNENKIKLENSLILISVLGSLMYIIQFLILPNILLNGMGYRINYRFGEPRFYIHTLLFALTFILCLIKLLFDKNSLVKKIIYIITIGLNIFLLINVVKTRSIMIAVIMCIILIIFFKLLKSSFIKASIFLCIGSLFVMLILSNDIVLQMLQLTTNSDDQSISIRGEEFNFYLDQFKQNFLIGRGEISPSLYPLIDGNIQKYFLDDLGFLGIVVKFGVLGIIGMLVGSFKYIRNIIIRNMIIQDKLFLIFVGLYIVISGVLIPYLDQGENIIYICIMISYIDNERKKSVNLIKKE